MRLSRHVTKELGMQFHLLDFDLQFSSYLNNITAIEGLDEKLDSALFGILQPAESSVEEAFTTIASSEALRPNGLLVLDSINTLQTMLRNPELDSDSASANHKASILITILQEVARYYSKTLWITSINRERPRTLDTGDISWEREAVGGRMLMFKSDLALSLHYLREEGENKFGKEPRPHDEAQVRVDRLHNGRFTIDQKKSYSIELMRRD